jgi:hypothetical protein
MSCNSSVNSNTEALNKRSLKFEKDSLANDVIKGNVVFRISTKEFFRNRKNKKLASINDLTNYVPVSFYFQMGKFYIPNRLDDEIIQINTSGLIVERISLPIDFEVSCSYITRDEVKYLMNKDFGLIVLDSHNNLIYKNDAVVRLIPDIIHDNVLIESRSPQHEGLFAAIDGRNEMDSLFLFKAHYYEHHLEGQFLFELSYDDMPNMFTTEERTQGLGKGSISLKKYNLKTRKLVQETFFMVDCKNCFDLPKLLSEKVVVATNFELKNGKSFNEVILLIDKNFIRFNLIDNSKIDPITDPYYDYLMNNGFVYCLDESRSKMYSLGTSESEIVITEYNIPKM